MRTSPTRETNTNTKTKYKKMIMKRTSPAGHHENQSNEKDEGSDDSDEPNQEEIVEDDSYIGVEGGDDSDKDFWTFNDDVAIRHHKQLRSSLFVPT